jgi:uncharacterized protein
MKTAIGMPSEQITKFCQHWQISELALFGSVLRDDFNANSDIDILVAFDATANWGLLDHAKMQEELGDIFSRPVDLISNLYYQKNKRYFSVTE